MAAFFNAYESSLTDDNSVPVAISLERELNHTTSHRLRLRSDSSDWHDINRTLVERLVKTMLWAYGGFRFRISAPDYIVDYIRGAYKPGGLRAFDAEFMSRVYERPFTVESVPLDRVPPDKSGARTVGRHLDGCRIGFDAGGSDRKVSAVIDGEAVYSEEVIWHPKTQADPAYHYSGILAAFRSAAEHMPRVDGIGVSSAGIYVANRTRVASLFLKVPINEFNAHVNDIYIRAAKAIGDVPLEVANDGDVTALAGAMDLNENSVLGIAMGTSEAGGFVDHDGNITGWLNELAFVPVDANPRAMIDEWSGDYGCGVKYFSQDAAAKLAPAAGIELDESLTPAEKLKAVQANAEKGHAGALAIFDTIGAYLGWTLAWYARFYQIKHVLILGRVTSGVGGERVVVEALRALSAVDPDLAGKLTLHLPDESNRRVGQSIAAASLPQIN
ncbi:MAG: ROK family protein [Oscillospiraceae bacterium]|jgi:predicted NBD/HSP70 family sugar kinase|nr:ROK family protein [Oscillospiraceae bacterium]